jgi:hypothetical protein
MNLLRSWRRVAFALAIAAPVATFAQSKVADPSDPAAAVPATSYRSVFSDYIAYQDATPVPWRKSNEAVLQTGGGASAQDMSAMPKDMPMPGRTMSADGMKAKE